MRSVRAIPLLIEIWRQPPDGSTLDGAAENALVDIGFPAVSPLIEALRDENKEVRSFAVGTLREPGSNVSVERAIPALMEAMEDEAAGVRQSAMGTLAALGVEEAVPLLAERMITDNDVGVRQAAAQALGEIGPGAKTAIPALKEALKDPDGPVRGLAKQALRRIEAE